MQTTQTKTRMKLNRWQRLWAAAGVFGALVAMVYYSLGIFDRVSKNSQQLKKQQQFDSISSLSIDEAPWIKNSWTGESNSKVRFNAIERGGRIFVVVNGLGFGDFEWEPEEVSKSGLLIRGKAICINHGGTIDEAALLQLKPNNTMSFKVANRKVVLVRSAPNSSP